MAFFFITVINNFFAHYENISIKIESIWFYFFRVRVCMCALFYFILYFIVLFDFSRIRLKQTGIK